ncbi:glycoside hydrolase family 13 protein [Laccaria amethystina LaAM-08-1]|uniref:alpha-amylase n=1 Tax=Laccaria amethystina LaAM-08-1 TaxID=1095629 RepID=A0A0C9XA28_9AGAR|nr:glycoside hydrolase family 13 protein [Laccaria amethystina LaAM-08-1]
MFATRFSVFSVILLAVPTTLAGSASDWRGRAIYQLLTDRFSLSNDSATPCNTTQVQYCGGTWNGITNHLDYIQGLGFDSIWISPVVANVEQTTAYGQAYHGYWAQDITSLNAHFGTADDLKALSSALHKRNMYLMVDIVVNHFVSTSSVATSDNATLDFSKLVPFSKATDFHPYCLVTDYNNQTNVEQCWLGDEHLPLADLNTEDPSIVSTMNNWIEGLVKSYGIDGLRIDTAKHIRKDFWPAFAKAAGVFTMGEVLIGDVGYAAPYTEVLDSVLDYPNYYTLTSSFSSQTGNFSALISSVTASQQSYSTPSVVGSFLENHDNPRFQSITQDISLVKNAMTWPFIQDGIPILYQGQEQGFTGGAEPSNREALWPTAFQMSNKPLVAHVTTLNAVRKAAAAANSSFLTTPLKFITQQDPSLLAVSKPPLIALLTNLGSNSTKSSTWVASGVASANEVLVDVLSCATVKADGSGGVSVAVVGGLPQVLIPASALAKNGTVCPSVATGSTGSSSSGGGSGKKSGAISIRSGLGFEGMGDGWVVRVLGVVLLGFLAQGW